MAVFALLFSNVPPQLTAAAEQYTCGSEKHLHSESCYEKKLACGEEEAAPHYKSTFKVHKHTEKCRDSEGRIVCGYVENEYYHTHNEFCRDAEGNLACGLKEQKPHEHTDACYETDRILICENEDPGHTHTGSCYTEKRVLACEKAEEEGHHHSDGCYAETVIRTCGLEENPGHHHTEECWQDWTELTEVVNSVYTGFTEKLYSLYRMSEQDYHVSLLIKVRIQPKDIALLTAHSKESVASTRSRLYSKVFGMKGSSKDWDDFILSL